jgi:predicted RNA binding protein YcfA (HicA-like mRNA interferase family)
MSRRDKLVARLQERPNDSTWNELSTLLKSLGYRQAKPGRTGGSRRRFVHPTLATVTLHKPHPKNVLKMYVIEDILEFLEREGVL